MNSNQSSLRRIACACLALAAVAMAAPAGKLPEPLPNGDFKKIGPKPKWAHQILTKDFPLQWEGGRVKLRSDGRIDILPNGHLNCWLVIPQNGRRYQLTVEAKVSGKGKISMVTRTDCGREGKWGPFRKGGGVFETYYQPKAEVQTFRFSRKTDPYEQGVFYIMNKHFPSEPIVVESVRATLTELKP